MGLANWLTILRIVLVPVFVVCLVYHRMTLSVVTFGVAAVTDLMDGYIARTRGAQTRLGAFLDPLADKLLLVAAFVTLTYRFPKILPFWLTTTVLSRDAILILVAGLVMLTGGRLHPQPTLLGKLSTVFQMLMVSTALLIVAGTPGAHRARPALIAATAALTVASGIQYLALAPRFVDWDRADPPGSRA
jgi:cardiolipin synthase